MYTHRELHYSFLLWKVWTQESLTENQHIPTDYWTSHHTTGPLTMLQLYGLWWDKRNNCDLPDSLQDETECLNNALSKNNYNKDFVRWNTHSNKHWFQHSDQRQLWPCYNIDHTVHQRHLWHHHTQHAKKVVTDNLRLVDFAIGLVIFVLTGKCYFAGKFKLQKDCNQSC